MNHITDDISNADAERGTAKHRIRFIRRSFLFHVQLPKSVQSEIFINGLNLLARQ